MSTGTFSGNPKTEWLTSAVSPDRDMKLLENFSYDDPSGRKWLAPVNSVINGASIPIALWSTVGSPYTGGSKFSRVLSRVNEERGDLTFEELEGIVDEQLENPDGPLISKPQVIAQ